MYINLIDIEGEYDKKIAMKADRAAREVNEQDAVLCTDEEVSSGLAKWADVMLQNLDKEIDDVDAVLCTDEEVSSVLAKRADVMLQNLDKEIDDVDAEIGYRWRGLDRYCDGTVSPEMVAAAALYLKDAMGKEGIQKLISNISDHNGVDLVPGGKISRETLITCTCVGLVPYNGFRGKGCDVFKTGRCVNIITDDTSKI